MTEKSEALRLADYMDDALNDPNNVADAVSAELRRLSAVETQRDALLEAYRKMKNVAAGYSNLCDDSASTSKLEREFEAADAIARAAIKAVEGE